MVAQRIFLADFIILSVAGDGSTSLVRQREFNCLRCLT